MENADYMATHKDYSESVDALERAIAVLKKQAYDRSQAELMQVAPAPLSCVGGHQVPYSDVFCTTHFPIQLDRSRWRGNEAAEMFYVRVMS